MNNEEKNTLTEQASVEDSTTTKKNTNQTSTETATEREADSTAIQPGIIHEEAYDGCDFAEEDAVSEPAKEVTEYEECDVSSEAPILADQTAFAEQIAHDEDTILDTEIGSDEESEADNEVFSDDSNFADEIASDENATADEDDGKSATTEIAYKAPTRTAPEDNTSANEVKSGKKARTVDSVFDFIELFVFTLAAVLIITSFFFRHSIVDGPSMMGTLQDGETLIISDFMYTPKAGDIIVCEDYTTALKKPIVKRVIATEGQTIRITKDAIYIDCDPFAPGAEPLDEPYAYISDSRYSYFNPIGGTAPMPAMTRVDTVRGTYYELTVPEGEVFVMGDHRNNSTDSRTIGTVSEDSVLGRVLFRVYPFSEFGKVE